MDHEVQDSSAKKITVETDSKGADAHHMPIPHRSFVTSGNANAEGSSDDSGDDQETRSSILPTAKRSVIKPDADFKMDAPKDEEKPVAQPSQKFMDTKPPVKRTADPSPAPASAPTPVSAETESTDTVADIPATPDSRLAADAQKAAALPTLDQEKRRQEVEDIIESHKYFVPVDAIVRRRTIKINVGLTIVILILALLLIDLMLDSGMILLVQKIPHTHFFTLSNTK